MKEHTYFTCMECKYSGKALRPNWSRCNHPVIKELDFSCEEMEKYTDSDYKKLERLVNDIFQMVIISVHGETPNFEFPFEFESTWITSCKGFVKSGKRSIAEIKWYSGPNK